MIPISTSGKPNVASTWATRRSAASASSNPPPRHQPEIAATVSWGSEANRSCMSPVRR